MDVSAIELIQSAISMANNTAINAAPAGGFNLMSAMCVELFDMF